MRTSVSATYDSEPSVRNSSSARSTQTTRGDRDADAVVGGPPHAPGLAEEFTRLVVAALVGEDLGAVVEGVRGTDHVAAALERVVTASVAREGFVPSALERQGEPDVQQDVAETQVVVEAGEQADRLVAVGRTVRRRQLAARHLELQMRLGPQPRFCEARDSGEGALHPLGGVDVPPLEEAHDAVAEFEPGTRSADRRRRLGAVEHVQTAPVPPECGRVAPHLLGDVAVPAEAVGDEDRIVRARPARLREHRVGRVEAAEPFVHLAEPARDVTDDPVGGTAPSSGRVEGAFQ
jgi:hypothetical protein